MSTKVKLSDKTQSLAYQFIKSMLKDGANGEDIHELVGAISDNLGSDIGGQILMDLLMAPGELESDQVFSSSWFGPMHYPTFRWITRAWADYCKDNNLRGQFRFGDISDWKDWREQHAQPVTDERFNQLIDRASHQLCVFEWYGDPLESNKVAHFLAELYQKLEEVDE